MTTLTERYAIAKQARVQSRRAWPATKESAGEKLSVLKSIMAKANPPGTRPDPLAPFRGGAAQKDADGVDPLDKFRDPDKRRAKEAPRGDMLAYVHQTLHLPALVAFPELVQPAIEHAVKEQIEAQASPMTAAHKGLTAAEAIGAVGGGSFAHQLQASLQGPSKHRR